MADQMLANQEKSDAVAVDEGPGTPKELVKRMKNAISMSIGLCEIRMSIFLWDLFRMGKQEEN